MIGRKGQAEESFHWVFIIIAGAVILLVFGVFIYKIKYSGEIEAAADLLNDLNLILAGGEISTKTVNQIDNLPNVEIEFDCHTLSIGGSQLDLNNKGMFGPRSIRSTRMSIWSYDWAVPFYVMNFLFVASPSQHYVFVGRGDLADTFGAVIPEDFFSLQFVDDISTVTYNGHDVTKFIFLDTEVAEVPTDFLGRETRVMEVRSDGVVVFYDPAPIEQGWLGTAGLLAAVFSDDAAMYTCGMNTALDRLGRIAKVYTQRTRLLQSRLQIQCPGYNSAPFERIQQLSQQRQISTASVGQYATALQNQNVLMQQLSCPLIY